MKGGLAATVLAAWTSSVAAALPGQRHGRLFAKRSNDTNEMCLPGCTTIWKVITGEATLVPMKVTTTTAMATTTSVATTTITIMSSPPSVAPVPIPTPEAKLFPTPGTYTLPATTITLSQPTTVVAPTTTQVPAGTHTVGGVTTVVKVATTVTCPVATVVTYGSVTTSTIVQTKYVCPSAGTYTVGPVTTAVSSATVITYPVPTSYSPGTYVAKKEVVTVTKSGFVYRCPFSKSALPTPATPSPVTPQPTAPMVPTTEKKVVPATPESVEAPSAPTSVEAPVAPPKQLLPSIPIPSIPVPKMPLPPSAPAIDLMPAAPTQTPKQAVPTNSKLVSDNDHFGITYTPYQASNGACKSAGEVDKDLAELKRSGFSTVRVYSTDCNALENIGNACKKHDLSMIVGIFVKGGGCSYQSPDIKQQVDKLSQWHQWDRVKLVVVGNEAIMNGYCKPEELSRLITTVKSRCSSYKGPYTVSETLDVWQRPDVAAAICGVTNVTGANIHPFFNKEVTPGSAGQFVAGQLDLLRKICPGHEDVINLECGWPTRGKCNGKACPGKEEQAEAIKSIRKATGDKTVFFSYQDDMWKKEGECGCEQSWGTAASFAVSSIL
ncbi:hypothetical protein L249_7231 [Ophiocordyceps polyrhachis-furcata BCC 54312]|uniref:Probable beta-glucosidase btgE n=1 Tax=Ophiocordyceps polyrhachis-furcata BCC 54312 TaxID=1330021 RepID=A0A367LB52_9HYPO|nr:hypothetical protein L249_7231 [Ophiocordyceps polyrhachis-furcata BCC 54312]